MQDNAARRTSYGERPALDARNLENHSLAARLAQREVRRRDTQRRSVRQAGVSDAEEQERRTGGDWGTWDDEYARQTRPGDDLSSQIQEVARLQSEGQRASYAQVWRVVPNHERALANTYSAQSLSPRHQHTITPPSHILLHQIAGQCRANKGRHYQLAHQKSTSTGLLARLRLLHPSHRNNSRPHN